MKNNIIPRKFSRITGKMLINTNMNKINDIVNIYKDEYQGYRLFNTRTNKYACCFVDMLRNPKMFELIEIEV